MISSGPDQGQSRFASMPAGLFWIWIWKHELCRIRVWRWGLNFCLTLHWLTKIVFENRFWGKIVALFRIAPLQVGHIYLETLLSVLFETKLFLKTAFEAKLLLDIDWLIVASSGLRGKRPIRRSGKKLPTFCVFCKVIVFSSTFSSSLFLVNIFFMVFFINIYYIVFINIFFIVIFIKIVINFMK